jgi:hypothetical protein
MHDDEHMFALDETDPPSGNNKILVSIISIILLLLFVSYFVFAPVSDTLRGRLRSEEIRNNTLQFEDITLQFTNDTESYLAQLYTDNQEVRGFETSACLKGERSGNTYTITEVFEPQIFSQSYNHVNFETCPSDTLVMLHTHPHLRCEASTTDKETFENRKERSPDLLMVIMCAPNNYVVYT